MKIQKTDLAQKLNKIKGAVPKKTTMPVLQGILVRDGYLIASNMEMTVKAKIEGTEGESFIIPERAFDLINNLPDGEMEISAAAGNIITIKADKIKNKYQTLDPAQFPTTASQDEGSELRIKAEMILESMKRVSCAGAEYQYGNDCHVSAGDRRASELCRTGWPCAGMGQNRL